MTFVVAGKTKSPKSPSGWAVERAGRAKSNYNQSGLKLNLVRFFNDLQRFIFAEYSA